MTSADTIDRRTPLGVQSLWRQRLMRELAGDAPVRLMVRERVNGFLPSLVTSGNLQIDGHLGDYALANLAGGDVKIVGCVDYAAACGMASGTLEIEGDADAMLAANCRGGSILLRGSCGSDCGAAMQQGDICVTGEADARCGHAMRGGALVIVGSAGPGLGYRMVGGTIYVRGFAGEIDPGVAETRMRESDRLRLSLILLKANVGVSPREFRTYRPVEVREPPR